MESVREIVREYVCNDEEFLKLGDGDALSVELDFLFDNDMVEMLDKPYLDIAYLRVGDLLVNLDSLYLNIKAFMDEDKPKFEEFDLTPTEAILLNDILEIELLTDADNFEFEADYEDYIANVSSILDKLRNTYNVLRGA